MLFAVGTNGTAQPRTTLRKIEILGLQRLPAEQAIAATGLRIGDSIDGSIVDGAADKLMRSGWFQSVSYRVRSADGDTTVIFEVTEKPASSTSATGDVLGQVIWTGNSALSTEDLSNAFSLRSGDPAPLAKIDQGLGGVRKAYGRRGYINVQIFETMTRDTSRGRVNYEFTIREGRQYRMGLLSIRGLPAGDARQLSSKWTLAPDTIFDDSYLEQFSTTVIRPFVANRTQRTGLRSKFDVNTKPDTQKQTVDVIITFR